MTNEDLLYGYFSNTLTEDELTSFNKKLEIDTSFKAQFEFENNLKQAIKSKESIALKEKLKIFETEISSEKPQIIKSKFNWRVAASIIIFLGASWFGYNSLFSINYNTLYGSNFSSYPNTEFAITRSDTIDSFERKAFVAYEAEDYENAISYFNSMPKAEQKPYHSFYKAQAYLKINNTKKAKALFENTITDNTKFVAESHWYLALIAIKNKDKTEATKQLQTLTQSFNYNNAKAKLLLKDLH